MLETATIPPSEKGPIDETEAVAKLHINHDKVVKGEMPASEKLLTDTREDLSRLECYPMFKEYSSGVVPTLDVLAQSARRAVQRIEQALAEDKAKGTPDEELAEEIKLKNLIAGRADSIKRGVNSYIQTIIRFHTLKRLAHGGRDASEQFVKADESRIRAHDGLLKSLAIFTTSVKQAVEAGLIDKKSVHEWNHGVSSKEIMTDENAIVVFSEKMLDGRDEIKRSYIKDWAIAADFDSQLHDILDAYEQSVQQNGK